MNKELKILIKKIEQIAPKMDMRPFQALDAVIDFYADIIKKGETKIRYKEHQYRIAECGEALTNLIINNPFEDVLGRAREELSSTNKDLAQFYTPPSISNSVYALLDFPKNGKPKRFSDIACGTGSLTLKTMAYRENPDDYYFFVDIDEIALQAFLLQILGSYKATGKELPWIEMICGDGLFIEPNHWMLYQNTGRHLYDNEWIRRYGVFKEEVKAWDLMKLPLVANL